MEYEEKRKPIVKRKGINLYTRLNAEYAEALMEIKEKFGCSSFTETIIELVKYFQRNGGKNEEE